jgi:hypothetical protein
MRWEAVLIFCFTALALVFCSWRLFEQKMLEVNAHSQVVVILENENFALTSTNAHEITAFVEFTRRPPKKPTSHLDALVADIRSNAIAKMVEHLNELTNRSVAPKKGSIN